MGVQGLSGVRGLEVRGLGCVRGSRLKRGAVVEVGVGRFLHGLLRIQVRALSEELENPMTLGPA